MRLCEGGWGQVRLGYVGLRSGKPIQSITAHARNVMRRAKY